MFILGKILHSIFIKYFSNICIRLFVVENNPLETAIRVVTIFIIIVCSFYGGLHYRYSINNTSSEEYMSVMNTIEGEVNNFIIQCGAGVFVGIIYIGKENIIYNYLAGCNNKCIDTNDIMNAKTTACYIPPIPIDSKDKKYIQTLPNVEKESQTAILLTKDDMINKNIVIIKKLFSCMEIDNEYNYIVRVNNKFILMAIFPDNRMCKQEAMLTIIGYHLSRLLDYYNLNNNWTIKKLLMSS